MIAASRFEPSITTRRPPCRSARPSRIRAARRIAVPSIKIVNENDLPDPAPFFEEPDSAYEIIGILHDNDIVAIEFAQFHDGGDEAIVEMVTTDVNGNQHVVEFLAVRSNDNWVISNVSNPTEDISGLPATQ